MFAVGWTCEIRVCIRVMRHGRLGTINWADRLAILTLDACHVQHLVLRRCYWVVLQLGKAFRVTANLTAFSALTTHTLHWPRCGALLPFCERDSTAAVPSPRTGLAPWSGR